MSTSNTAIRFATILFLLAGLLLLKKPVFGQTADPPAANPASQTIAAPALKPLYPGGQKRIRTNITYIESAYGRGQK